MTTPPTDPGQGGPQEPQNPYGAPPTPPYGAPSPPPAYGQPSPPAYGQPAPPAYGQPAAPAPYGQPAAPAPYGQPAAPPPYGQPYGQPGYPGQPGAAPYGQPFPTGPAEPQPSKGMAVAALVLSVIGCIGITGLVSIVLAVLVLRKGRDGRNHGKGLAIAAIIISIVWFLVIALVIVLAAVGVSQLSSVDDLKAGQCITAKGLGPDSGDSVSQIRKVSCTSSHDGEVLATHTLTATEAKTYGDDESRTLCQTEVTAAGKIGVVSGQVNVVGLTTTLHPGAGDHLACIAFNADGSKLTAPLGS